MATLWSGLVSPCTYILDTNAHQILTRYLSSTLHEFAYAHLPVRSDSKGDYLKNLFKSDKFSYAIVTDIEKEDAFDEVVKAHNFDGILHTASPFHVSPKYPLADLKS